MPYSNGNSRYDQYVEDEDPLYHQDPFSGSLRKNKNFRRISLVRDEITDMPIIERPRKTFPPPYKKAPWAAASEGYQWYTCTFPGCRERFEAAPNTEKRLQLCGIHLRVEDRDPVYRDSLNMLRPTL